MDEVLSTITKVSTAQNPVVLVKSSNVTSSASSIIPVQISSNSNSLSLGPQVSNSIPKVICSPVNLSEQPTVTVKLGANPINVKIVTNPTVKYDNSVSPQKVTNGSISIVATKPVVEQNPVVVIPKTSGEKLTREQSQLEASIKSSLVLTQMVMGDTDRKSRGRKKKSESPAVVQENETGKKRTTRSKSVSAIIDDDDENNLKDLKVKGRRSQSRTRIPSPTSSNSGSMTSLLDDSGQSTKRLNMRSANNDFAEKRKSFMKEVIRTQESSDDADDTRNIHTVVDQIPSTAKKGWSCFCWRCYQIGEFLYCINPKCKRSYHHKCVQKQQQPINPTDKWMCPECIELDNAEKINNGKPKFDKDFVCTLLTFVYNRMSSTKNSNLLEAANDDKNVPEYNKFIVNPMNLNILHTNIKSKKYKSIEAFHSDAKWLLFNCAVLPEKRRYLPNAKNLLKVCRQEILEIETCFECYFKANTDPEWFIDVCSTPHLLVWAKLRGFPYWPAKAMSINAQTGQVNVRFFGAHDRAWIYVKDCYLYSKEDPNGTNPKKQNDIAVCIKEVNTHIEKLSETFNGFRHAALRTPYNPARDQQQLKQMLPNIDRFNRTTDINKLVEALLSGHKPKLTLKIIRTADNTLATSGLETNGTEKDDQGITKFKILNNNKKNYQIMPVASNSNDSSKLNLKRNADSWMIQEPRLKKQKSIESEESEIEKQKGNLMKSLNLERRENNIANAKKPTETKVINEEINKIPSAASDTSDNLLKRKKSNTAPPDDKNEKKKSESDKGTTDQSQVKRRSQRNKSLSGNNDISPISISSTETAAATPPKVQKMSEPPPLVPFDIQIKPDPDAEVQPTVNRLNTSLQPTVSLVSHNTTPPERITVKNINQLTKNPKPTRNMFSNSEQVVGMKPGTMNATASITKVSPANHMNGPKRIQTQQQQQQQSTLQPPQLQQKQQPPKTTVPIQNMVCIPSNSESTSTNNISTASNSSNESNSDPALPVHAMDGFITPSFAKAVTDTIVRAPPKLTKNSTANNSRSALRSDSIYAPFSSDAGPTSRLLADNAHRIADFFRNVLTESISDLATNGSLEAKIRKLELENEQLKQKHAKEMAEVTHNADMILSQMKKSQEQREQQLIEKIRRDCEIERIRAVEKAIEETKNKNWCTYCKREAIYHCCSNTWYCGLQCQQKDWVNHMRYCHNNNGNKQDTVQHDKTLTQTHNSGNHQKHPQRMHAMYSAKTNGPMPVRQPIVPIKPQQQQQNVPTIQQRTSSGPQIISVRGMVKQNN